MKKIIKDLGQPKKKYKYPFMELEVNDGFIAGKMSGELQRNMYTLGQYYTKTTKRKFTTLVNEDGMLWVTRIK